MELKAVVASLTDLDREFADLQKRIASADRELEVAERKREEAVIGPLYVRLEESKQARSDASRAKQELFHTCEDSELKRQLDHANAEIQRLLEANKDLATHAAWLDIKSDADRDRVDTEMSERDREHRRERSVLFRKQADSLRRQIKANEKAQTDALKRRDEIEERMRLS